MNRSVIFFTLFVFIIPILWLSFRFYLNNQILSLSIKDEKVWRDYSLIQNNQLKLEKCNCGTCCNFFSLWLDDCVKKYQNLDEKLGLISFQMKEMNSTFTLFTTSSRRCVFRHPNTVIIVINQTDILLNCGFSSVIDTILSWDKSHSESLYGIFRICISKLYKMSYFNLDVHFLYLNKTIFECTYVSAAIYKDKDKDNLDLMKISNSAFCLPTDILNEILEHQLRRIVFNSSVNLQSDLGSSAIQNVIINRHNIALLSHNNPMETKVELIGRGVRQHGHTHIHLPQSIRRINKGLRFNELVNAIRIESHLPLIIPSQTLNS